VLKILEEIAKIYTFEQWRWGTAKTAKQADDSDNFI